jgi:hypothetical protein
MAEEKYLSKDLKEVLKEMSKAPGGNVAQPRPVTPGPILGGPPAEPKPGVVDPATGVRTYRDPAISLFRFYAYGEEKPSRLPSPAPDVKTVTVTEQEMLVVEKAKRKALKEAGKKVTTTAERKAINAGVRGGVIGGMSRAPGSKPPVTPDVEIARGMATVRARQAADLQIIRDALERFAKTEMSEVPRNFLSREEQKYLDLLAQRVRDAIMEREAATKEALAARGDMTSAFEDYKAMQEAERRTLEGRQAAEKTRTSRQKTEQSLIDKSKPPVTPRAPMGAIPPIMPGGGLLDLTK